MFFNNRYVHFARAAWVALFLLCVCAAPALAQRGGTGARGGSTRPEKAQPDTTERQTTTPVPAISSQSVNTTAQPTPSPTPEPEPEPTPFCDTSEPGTCPGTFSFSYGFVAAARPRHSAGTSQRAVGGFAFSTYVTRRVFVEIDNDNFVSLKPEGGPRTTGIGDTVLIVGGDPLLEKEGSSRPAIYALYGVKIPTASSTKGIGSGEVDHFVAGAVNKTVGRSYLELNFTEYFSGRSDSGGFDETTSLAGVFERTVGRSDKAKLHFEVGGTFATQASNAEMYTLDYVQFAVSDRAAIRVGGRFGLTPNVSRAGLYLALKFSGNLKEIFK
ncbi:MAG TPA: hypothetical protein VGV38_13880 [Pyrinomonadaceae bacterium]|nr:hypothetical protein [Pyrinomonadaceae bacterium]